MKKLIVLLAVMALCAGTAQAFTWDLMDDDFGSDTGKSSAQSAGWYVHPFTANTVNLDSHQFMMAGGSTHSDVNTPGDIYPSTYTAEIRMKIHTDWYGMVINTRGSPTNPAAELEYEFAAGVNGNIRTRDNPVGTFLNYTPNGSWDIDEWHVITFINETGAGTDRFRIYIDDPTLSGAAAADHSAVIASQPGTAVGWNVWNFDAPHLPTQTLLEIDYFKMGAGVIPEPATLAVLGLAGVAALLRRRK